VIKKRGSEPIDWVFWNLKGYVKDYEAAALSLGMNPDEMEVARDSWMGGPRARIWFASNSFKSDDGAREFDKRYRLAEAWARQYGDKIRHHNTRELNLGQFAAWACENELTLPPQLAKLASRDRGTATEPHQPPIVDPDIELAKLFDPVGPDTLDTMFPAEGRWSDWCERADRNGLKVAKEGRNKWNPYVAAKWWLEKQVPKSWDMARCRRTLAKNLPARSAGQGHLVTLELP